MMKKQPLALWTFVLAALVLVIFSVQNAQEVGFKFFVWETHLSLSILLIVAFLLGLIAGAFFSFRQTQKDKHRAKELQEKNNQPETYEEIEDYNEKDKPFY
ncbi:MAG: LapA family protein [Marinilabiliaceae bacterium]